MTTDTLQRTGAAVVLLVATAGAIAGCSGGSNSPRVASLPPTGAPSSTGAGASRSASPPASDDPTRLVDQWATCERQHGDPTQADPVIDAHGVINIVIPPVEGGAPVVTGGPETPTGRCAQYLAAAQRALRAANPVAPPPTRSELFSYTNCMRANGIANYPYPTGEKANFNGTGIDLNSPKFIHANNVCGKQINAPAWWINGWGPPGDISVRSSLLPQSNGMGGNG